MKQSLRYQCGLTRIEWIIFAVIVVGLATVMITTSLNSGIVRQAMEAAVPPVIKALDAYRAKNGAYPKSLEQLVPSYLPEVPSCNPRASAPSMGYLVDAKPGTGEAQLGEYELSCFLFMFTRLGYSSKTMQWYTWD